MITFTPEPEGWFWVDLPNDHRYVSVDYDYTDQGHTRVYASLIDEVRDWIHQNVEAMHFDVIQESNEALTLYLHGHANAVAFQMRWG